MAAASKVSLKLLIDTKSQKGLFAEADKKTVDFLFYILSLPVGTVIRLLNSKQGMVGCLANLYKSIENLSETYIQPNQTKDTLLKPRASDAAATLPLLSLTECDPIEKSFYSYRCGSHFGYVAGNPSAVCPQCRCNTSTKITYVEFPPVTETKEGENEGGFVKSVVTYMIMDDLVVKPMSTISSIALLNKFNVEEVGALEEKMVDLGMNEVVSHQETIYLINA